MPENQLKSYIKEIEKQPPLKSVQGKDIPISGIYRITTSDLKSSKNGKQFLLIKISDKTCELEAKKWDSNIEELNKLKKARTVIITGKSDDFGGKASIICNSIESIDLDENDYNQLFLSSKYVVEDLKKGVWNFIKKIKNKFIKQLAEELLKDPLIKEKLPISVAAVQFHHPYRAGLLTHVLRLMQLSEVIVDSLNNNPYPNTKYIVNKDLVIFLALTHDIMKITEYNLDGSYSLVGGLIPHLPSGALFVDKKINTIKDFPEELRTQIIHGILSHHGKIEYGSPVVPMTVEAQLFHYIDYLSSKVDPMIEALDSLQPGQVFTDRLKALDGKQAYMGGNLLYTKENGYVE